jgi:hypothetical protein
MRWTFEPNFGESGSALGTYDTDTRIININLDGIFCFDNEDEDFCYQDPEDFEDYLAEHIYYIIVHETLHLILAKLEGARCCHKLDHISKIWLEWLEGARKE